MNILELCLSPDLGGLELYVKKVISYLHSSDNVCHAVVYSGGEIESVLQENKLDTLRPRFRRLPFLSAYKLAGIIDAHNIDIIHIHWNKDLSIAVLAKIISKRSVKLIYTRHMGITRDKSNRYHRFLYARVDRFIAITKQLHHQANKYLPISEDKIQLLYPGISANTETNLNSDEAFKDTLFDKESFKIALFGRIENRKGQHVLLAALNNLIKEGYNVSISLIGHVMDKAYFEDLLDYINEHGLANHFHYHGFSHHPIALMSCFDAIVLTTYEETFGLVLIEGMHVNVPVIGTNAGGVPEIIKHGETGLLFEPGNGDSLASAIKQLLENPKLKAQITVNAKQFADENFSEERHFESLEKLFQEA